MLVHLLSLASTLSKKTNNSRISPKDEHGSGEGFLFGFLFLFFFFFFKHFQSSKTKKNSSTHPKILVEIKLKMWVNNLKYIWKKYGESYRSY